ncbi:MAG: phosphoglucosamine mutase [Immundisolibacter sp.]|uniref:phosphoglucosamine mutase n=1 Tax=Immundisolibacter sp. TaxID=1934948 RepID=UPI003EE3505D
MTARRYFGTDGVRGTVGEGFFTPDFVLRLGWAAGTVLRAQGRGAVVVGKDTRVSGYMLESALEAGLSAAGMDCVLLGPMPTPAVAYLTRTFHARAGIVISASHNAYPDNGIKLFSANGEKLPDALEARIEECLGQPLVMVPPTEIGKARRAVDAAGRYIEFCKRAMPDHLDLRGLKVVVDAANGAAYQVAPAVFTELGASVTAIGVSPDGFNINRDCGSTAPQALQREVLAQAADIGVALDGDADRLILVDASGELVDGDEILGLLALARHRVGRLGGGVVGTLMSNFGLERALTEAGIAFARAKVGDRHVMEQLRQRGWQLGGETSGHVISLDRSTTGDGLITALQVLAVMRESGRPLGELKRFMVKYPQRLVNVKLVPGYDPDACPMVQRAVEEAQADLSDRGRVLLRKSGTEPLVRVMVEGQDATQVDLLSERIAEQVRVAMAAR